MPRIYEQMYGKGSITISKRNGQSRQKKYLRTDPSIRHDSNYVEDKTWTNGVLKYHDLY